MSAVQQVLLSSISSAILSYRSELKFNQANGSTTFPDTGTLGASWAGSTGATNTTTGPLEGSASLNLAATSDYIEASGVLLPATANWDFSFMFKCASAPGGMYLASVQDASATAAGTQFAIYLGSGFPSTLNFYISDGTARTNVITGSNAIGTGVAYTVRVTRVSGTITMYLNGVVEGTPYTFGAASIPQPSGAVWRLGKPVFAPGITTTGLFDLFRLIY